MDNNIENLIKGLDFHNTIETQDRFYEQIRGIDLSGVSAGLAELIKVLDLSNLSVTQNRLIETIRSIDLTGTLGIVDQIKKINFSNLIEFKNILNESIKELDISTMLTVQNRVLNQMKGIDFSQFSNISYAINYIAEEYILDNDIDDSKEKDEILLVADNLLKGESYVEDLSPRQKVFFVNYIYPIILIFVQIIIECIISKPGFINNNNINNVNNYVTTINNYYIQEGFNKDFLNDNNLRIVSSKKATVREKRDCSSKIICELQIGKIVCVIDKYKKWVKVSWYSEDGKYYNGWIQNYKLTYFK